MSTITPEVAWENYRQAVLQWKESPTVTNEIEMLRKFAVFDFVFCPEREGAAQ